MTTASPTLPSHAVFPAVSVSYGADDAELSKVLSAPAGSAVTVMARAYRFIVAIEIGSAWSAHSGELGTFTYKELTRLASQGALRKVDWPDTLGDRPPSLPVSQFAPSSMMSRTELASWNTNRKSLMKLGRGPNLNSAAKEEVLKDAANVCMFEGCGKRVDKIGKSSRSGNVGQLAHIVGADPLGPRGREDSHMLADKAENVMLVCYDHHRLGSPSGRMPSSAPTSPTPTCQKGW